ncbi:MAG: glycerophosphodiester phosphodiesterase [Flavobacteriaceae bacterium]
MKKIALLLSVMSFITACSENVRPLVIGHRGARGHIAENTLPSIQKAIDLGVDGIEIDIFRCASGELVVFHDMTLEKLTNAEGYIEQISLDSIRKIAVLNDYAIPTLAEALELIDGQVLLNIELKGANTAVLTHELLQPYLAQEQWGPEHFIISSFNWKELQDFAAINTQIPIAVLTEDDPLDALPIAQQLNAVAINPNYQMLTPEIVQKIKKKGLKIYPWTINQPEDIKKAIDLAVDGIITDFPERVHDQLN